MSYYIGWDGREYEDAELEHLKGDKQVNTPDDDNSILVSERGGKLFSLYDNGYQSQWFGTKEQLHSDLVKRGYKRAGKQEGSDIGGLYVK